MKPTSDPGLPGVGQESLFDLQDYELAPPIYRRARRTASERAQAFRAALVAMGWSDGSERMEKAVDNYKRSLTALRRLL